MRHFLGDNFSIHCFSKEFLASYCHVFPSYDSFYPDAQSRTFFLSFEVTFSFSPSQILHPVHKPCFKVRTQKLSHFGIKLSKILKNGRVATAFFKIFTKRNNDRKKVSQSFFPFLFQRLLHHLWEILRWRLLWFLFFCQFCWRIAEQQRCLWGGKMDRRNYGTHWSK